MHLEKLQSFRIGRRDVEPHVSSGPIPASARIARVFFQTWSRCASKPSGIVPSGRTPTWPAVNSQRALGRNSSRRCGCTSPPARDGRRGCGSSAWGPPEGWQGRVGVALLTSSGDGRAAVSARGAAGAHPQQRLAWSHARVYVETRFAGRETRAGREPLGSAMHLASLYRYPVKGLTPEPLERALLDGWRRHGPSTAPGPSRPGRRVRPRRTAAPAQDQLPDADARRAAGDAQEQLRRRDRTLTILRDGKQVARGQLTTPLGRQLIEQFTAPT